LRRKLRCPDGEYVAPCQKHNDFKLVEFDYLSLIQFA
jgi:hypothetical protein